MNAEDNTPNPQHRTRRRWLGRSAFALVVGVIALIGGELFARYGLGLGDPPLSMAHPSIEYLFRPSRTYHRFGNTIHYNVYSMRSDDFPPTKQNPDELRIMMLGDSVINGGNLTDQSELASERLKRMLARKLDRPVVVGNISAGSWGPGNLDAYVQQYGMFDADLAIIVLNSEDWEDFPTFKPIVGVKPNFPSHTPTFALQELLTRYLPRYLPWLSSGSRPTASAASSPNSPGTASLANGQRPKDTGPAVRSLIKDIRKHHVPIVIAQHPARAELGGHWLAGHAGFKKVARQMNVPVVQLAPQFEKARRQGKRPYRDPLHPNPLGQRLIARRLMKVIDNYINLTQKVEAIVPTVMTGAGEDQSR